MSDEQATALDHTDPFDWPGYGYDDWEWTEEHGWVNPDDDPATPTEQLLLDTIRDSRRWWSVRPPAGNFEIVALPNTEETP